MQPAPATPSFVTELHTHTVHSDGRLTPTDLLAKCKESGVAVAAITDHDTTEALDEGMAAAAAHGIELLTGVEISCCEEGREIHLLGYCFDPAFAPLQAMLNQIRNERVDRTCVMLEKLDTLGYPLEMDDVVAHSGGSVIARPHIAAALVEKGYFTSNVEVFERVLYNGGPAYVPKEERSVRDATAMLHRCGGVAVLAHPGGMVKMREVVRFIGEGLDGIEVYHPAHTRATSGYYKNFASRYNVVQTGGSDYHGTRYYDENNFARYAITAEAIGILKDRSRMIRLNAISAAV
ncbi:MAG: PHP domain-containing protein [Candidatus Kapabacteria bacterium]|nr:PHP domain-containing protein [Candidatus Kapabacteria bacterium]